MIKIIKESSDDSIKKYLIKKAQKVSSDLTGDAWISDQFVKSKGTRILLNIPIAKDIDSAHATEAEARARKIYDTNDVWWDDFVLQVDVTDWFEDEGKSESLSEAIDGWDNRTGVIKRIASYLYNNPEAAPPKGYIARDTREYDYAARRYGDYVTTPFGNISTNDLMQYARDNNIIGPPSPNILSTNEFLRKFHHLKSKKSTTSYNKWEKLTDIFNRQSLSLYNDWGMLIKDDAEIGNRYERLSDDGKEDIANLLIKEAAEGQSEVNNKIQENTSRDDLLWSVSRMLSYEDWYDDGVEFHTKLHKDGSRWIHPDKPPLGDNDARRVKGYIEDILIDEYDMSSQDFEVIEDKYGSGWTILFKDSNGQIQESSSIGQHKVDSIDLLELKESLNLDSEGKRLKKLISQLVVDSDEELRDYVNKIIDEVIEERKK